MMNTVNGAVLKIERVLCILLSLLFVVSGALCLPVWAAEDNELTGEESEEMTLLTGTIEWNDDEESSSSRENSDPTNGFGVVHDKNADGSVNPWFIVSAGIVLLIILFPVILVTIGFFRHLKGWTSGSKKNNYDDE